MTDQLERRADADRLQEELRDLLSLAVLGDHVRWVVTGEGAVELAEWLTGAVHEWRAWADESARQLVTLDVAPDSRLRSLAEDIPVHWVPDGWLDSDEAARLVLERVAGLAGWARYRQSQAIEPGAVALLDTVASGLEAHAREGRTIARAPAADVAASV